jgi:hypothetical protein
MGLGEEDLEDDGELDWRATFGMNEGESGRVWPAMERGRETTPEEVSQTSRAVRCST